jgi:hypothetical protein
MCCIARILKKAEHITVRPVARPSIPSKKFSEFVIPSIHKNVMAISGMRPHQTFIKLFHTINQLLYAVQ